MSKITKNTFIQELLKAIPEFREIHETEKNYHAIGIHLIWGDFARFTEEAIDTNKSELLDRITTFLVRCYTENNNEVSNALFVSFFEHLNDEHLGFFYQKLPKDLSKEVRKYIKAWNEFIDRKKLEASHNTHQNVR